MWMGLNLYEVGGYALMAVVSGVAGKEWVIYMKSKTMNRNNTPSQPNTISINSACGEQCNRTVTVSVIN